MLHENLQERLEHRVLLCPHLRNRSGERTELPCARTPAGAVEQPPGGPKKVDTCTASSKSSKTVGGRRHFELRLVSVSGAAD